MNDEIRVFNPMRPLRFDVCHMPWYEQGKDEPDRRFTYEELFMYILIAFAADGFGRVDGSLREVYMHFPGGAPTTGEAHRRLGARIKSLCDRAEIGDAFRIMVTEETPDLDRLTLAKPLKLKVANVGAYTAEKGFFYLAGEDVLKIMKACDRRNCIKVLLTYVYLLSRMSSFKFFDTEQQIERTAACCWRLHSDLCAAIGAEERSITRYIKILQANDLIGYKSGCFRGDAGSQKQWSLFVKGPTDDAMMLAAERYRENYRRKTYNNGGKESYHSRRGPC